MGFHCNKAIEMIEGDGGIRELLENIKKNIRNLPEKAVASNNSEAELIQFMEARSTIYEDIDKLESLIRQISSELDLTFWV